MKKDFFGFYDPTQDEVNKTWKEGTFVFDTNSLINLYRYTESTRSDFLLALNKLKEKLFMPFQVGYEFHSNRRNVIDKLNESYSTLLSQIKKDETLQSILNQYSRHPSIEIDNIMKLKEDFVKKVEAELEKQKKVHPDFKNNDKVLDQLTEIFKNKVGKPYGVDELKKIYAEGKERYELKIPPGYKDLEDKRKRGERHMYGDLIIWKEIIALTIKEKKPIILVTDDRKEDWWTIEQGKTIRPREELIKEFHDKTGIRILIYSADSFLHFAKERKLVINIKEKSISEIKEVRKADEDFNKYSTILKERAMKAGYPSNDLLPSSLRDVLNADIYNFSDSERNLFTTSMRDVLNSDIYNLGTGLNPLTASMRDILNSEGTKSNYSFYSPREVSEILRANDASRFTQPATLVTQSEKESSKVAENQSKSKVDNDDQKEQGK